MRFELGFARNSFFLANRSRSVYDHYSNHNNRMNYSKKYDTRIPEINERIHEFLREKHLTGQVEHEFQTRDPNMPTGWAILTVDTSDPMLQGELNGFISNLESFLVTSFRDEDKFIRSDAENVSRPPGVLSENEIPAGGG
jgi:hypothetical protein